MAKKCECSAVTPAGGHFEDCLFRPMFTRGPWGLSHHRPLQVVDPDSLYVVADCMERAGHGLHNARLIAAAPELLVAVQGLLAVIEEYQSGRDEQSPFKRIQEAKDAVAKAIEVRA